MCKHVCKYMREFLSIYVYIVCIYVYMCVSVACYSDTDTLARSEPDPDTCSLWTRYNSDSKTNSWDDSVIRSGSCSEDQTVIRIQNYIISCEYLLLYHFLIYHCQHYLYVTCIILCDRWIYFTSMITWIISYNVSECLLYLYS